MRQGKTSVEAAAFSQTEESLQPEQENQPNQCYLGNRSLSTTWSSAVNAPRLLAVMVVFTC